MIKSVHFNLTEVSSTFIWHWTPLESESVSFE